MNNYMTHSTLFKNDIQSSYDILYRVVLRSLHRILLHYFYVLFFFHYNTKYFRITLHKHEKLDVYFDVFVNHV